MKSFDTAGPIKSEKHYNIPALSRWDSDQIYRLIDEECYFVLHAPRQTGKTTCLLALMERLDGEGNHTILYVNVEPAQAMRGGVETGMRTIVSSVARNAHRYLTINGLGHGSMKPFTNSAPMVPCRACSPAGPRKTISPSSCSSTRWTAW
uniref:AAA domain-containing protein n=1 Tax=Candidatus Kentrum sp. LFY TaxID=2126342 RepID=A0A450WWY8_9GAMM|nr:MAG: hypothetical protein BECKLFY1418C_GA0070996_10952 [Candidatus Kentron sp. LFY]